MKSGTILAIAVTGIVVMLACVSTGFLGFMTWALALNGYMGQERAVNASMITYIVLAALTAIITIASSIISVYLLSVRREWNAAAASVLSIVVFAITSGVVHAVCVAVSAIVAEQLRTTR